jgi:hypothetical protein
MDKAISAQMDTAKLREAVHFICKKMALEPHKLGAVKLQKIIWYFDVKSYLLTGRTATGATFTKGEFGPYTTDIRKVIQELVADDRLFTDTDDYHGNEKARLIGKGSTDLSVFSEKEKRWLEEITTDICENHSAASISERSHGAVWRMAAYGEKIPFAATATRLRKPSAEAVEAIKRELDVAP